MPDLLCRVAFKQTKQNYAEGEQSLPIHLAYYAEGEQSLILHDAAIAHNATPNLQVRKYIVHLQP